MHRQLDSQNEDQRVKNAYLERIIAEKYRNQAQTSSFQFLLKVRYAVCPRLYQNCHEIHDPKVSEARLGRDWHEKTMNHARIGRSMSYIIIPTPMESDAVTIESMEHCLHVPANDSVRTGSNRFERVHPKPLLPEP